MYWEPYNGQGVQEPPLGEVGGGYSEDLKIFII
jgi:hypothetical protein